MIDDLLNEELNDIEDIASEVIPQSFAAVVTATDWTTQTILSQLEKGNIELNPRFQRREAWRAPRKSQFIESLILGVPVPQIVLAERKEKRGSFFVIDGKQRLLSLIQFSGAKKDIFTPFSLRGLEIRKDLNSVSFSDLHEEAGLEEELSAFENSTIRTVVIRNWPDDDFLYMVFLRLNTGSVPLSPQELRQALHPGAFSDFVDEYSIESDLLHRVLHIKEPDFRMRDAELVIRYFAFRNFLKGYTGNLKPLLDKTTDRMNRTLNKDHEFVDSQVGEFEESIKGAAEVFDYANVFRKWNGVRYESALNRAVFDVFVLFLSDSAALNSALENRDSIVRLFKELCESNPDFRTSIEGTTKSRESIQTRLSIWSNFCAEETGIRSRVLDRAIEAISD